MTEDVGAIAWGLTKAQREVVLLASSEVPRPAYALRSDYDGRRACWDIRKTGVFEKVGVRGSQHWHYRLNERGVALQTHLLASQTSGEGDRG